MRKILIIFGLILLSFSIQAEGRKKYTVTGKAGNVNAFYYEMIECNLASADARARANELCYSKGYSYYTRGSFGRCKRRIFGGKSVKLTFYCE